MKKEWLPLKEATLKADHRSKNDGLASIDIGIRKAKLTASISAQVSDDFMQSMLIGLPLYPFMSVSITPLTQHPSAIAQVD